MELVSLPRAAAPMVTTSLKRGLRVAAKTAFTAADVFARRMPGPRLLIYHQIEAGLGRQMEVTETAFRQHLEWLAANGETVSLDRAVAERGRPGSDRHYVLTFDDGYRDMYDKAWPMLRDRAMPFVLYLTTHPTESGEPLTPGGRADPLTWKQVEEMLASGLMTLGAHTHRHRELGEMTVPMIEEEIGTSNELITKRTGVRPIHFAYPWGYWSEAAHPVVAAEYETATLGSGAPVTADRDPLKLNRVPVQLSDGVLFFRRKMATGLQPEDRLRRRLAHYDGP
jgi:peptidoglycan/xylan/chitin deacetylase (PgdA/CDA1 family)